MSLSKISRGAEIVSGADAYPDIRFFAEELKLFYYYLSTRIFFTIRYMCTTSETVDFFNINSREQHEEENCPEPSEL